MVEGGQGDGLRRRRQGGAAAGPFKQKEYRKLRAKTRVLGCSIALAGAMLFLGLEEEAKRRTGGVGEDGRSLPNPHEGWLRQSIVDHVESFVGVPVFSTDEELKHRAQTGLPVGASGSRSKRAIAAGQPPSLTYYAWNFSAGAGPMQLVASGDPNPSCSAGGAAPNFAWTVTPGVCTHVFNPWALHAASDYFLLNSSTGSYGVGALVRQLVYPAGAGGCTGTPSRSEVISIGNASTSDAGVSVCVNGSDPGFSYALFDGCPAGYTAPAVAFDCTTGGCVCTGDCVPYVAVSPNSNATPAGTPYSNAAAASAAATAGGGSLCCPFYQQDVGNWTPTDSHCFEVGNGEQVPCAGGLTAFTTGDRTFMAVNGTTSAAGIFCPAWASTSAWPPIASTQSVCGTSSLPGGGCPAQAPPTTAAPPTATPPPPPRNISLSSCAMASGIPSVTIPSLAYGLADCDCYEEYYMQQGLLDKAWTNITACTVKPVPKGIDPCVYVTCASGCQVQPDSGYVNYLRLPFCELHGSGANGGAVIILIVWLLVLFVALGTTAEDFFCPSLAVISTTLGLSDNVAGVTFLALGNGAPDIFSVYAGVVNTQTEAGGSLAIGELFGAGTFVTTVVFGAVSFVAPFTLTRRPFLRDCVTYFVATIYLFVVMLKGSITLGESVGFLIIYIAYVCVVVFGRKIYQARKKRQLAEQGLGLDDDDDDDRLLLTAVTTNNIYEGDPEFEQNKGHAPHHDAHHHNHTSDLAMKAARKGSYGIDDLAAHAARAPIYEDSQLQLHSVEEDDEEPQADKELSILGQLKNEFYPFDDDFSEQKWYWKIYGLVRAPIFMLLVLTVPIVDYDEPDHRWCRPLNTMHCVFGLLGFAFASQLAIVPVAGAFLTWELLLVIGVFLAVLVWRTTSDDKPPKLHAAFAYIGFAVAIMWISAFANEIVNILQTLGRLIGVSDAILGLTVLAWGNSIGDLVADVTVARNGFPRMGVGAAIGGPAMNMMIGIGIACTIKCGKIGGPYKLQAPDSLIASGLFLMVSLLSSMTVVPFNKFAVGRKYGMWLFLVYAAMFITSVTLSLS
eukprot:m.207077 g.207077  ORF g.207077 m.207077 type:complete len:1066 (-) comp15442_c0_seq1:261-3458(-)